MELKGRKGRGRKSKRRERKGWRTEIKGEANKEGKVTHAFGLIGFDSSATYMMEFLLSIHYFHIHTHFFLFTFSPLSPSVFHFSPSSYSLA